MAGRKPKPTALKALQGTLRKDRVNHSEPRPALIMPSCPDHLNVGARAEWNRICQELYELGLLTGLDVGILAGYCTNFARWAEAERNIQKHGTMVVTPNGYEQPSSWIGIANKSLELMRKYMVELGLTPASRPKISAKPLKDDKDQNPFDQF